MKIALVVVLLLWAGATAHAQSCLPLPFNTFIAQGMTATLTNSPPDGCTLSATLTGTSTSGAQGNVRYSRPRPLNVVRYSFRFDQSTTNANSFSQNAVLFSAQSAAGTIAQIAFASSTSSGTTAQPFLSL